MLSDRINIIMELLKLSGKQVASDIGVGEDMVSRYRKGKSEPSYKVLTYFCKAYYVRVEWMVTGEGEVFRKKEIDRLKEAKKILREVAIVKIERNITQKEIQESLGLPKGFFTDLKKGTISMPLEKIREFQKRFGVSIN